MNNELTLQCPNCNTMNRATAKRCRTCGKPLLGGTPTNKLGAATSAATNTAPLPAPIPNGFSDLPVGALVNDRYEILYVWSAPEHNVYRVTDEKNAGEEWLLYEAANPNEFEGAQRVLDKKVQHPGIARVGHVFVETQYANAPRGYMTTEYTYALAPEQVRLQESDVLKYGADLGQALEALHAAGLAHNNIQLASLALHDNQLKLTQLGQVAPLTNESRQADIYNLARVLQALLTTPGKTAALLSPTTGELFQRALLPGAPQSFATAAAFAAACNDALASLRRPQVINLNVGRLTDVGVKRGLNEDAFATADYARAIQKGGQAMGLFVVSDGMGGAAAGEVASQIVIDRMIQEFNQSIAPMFADNTPGKFDYGSALKTAGEKASRAVYDERMRLRNDMGATLVATLIVGMQAHFINVGDSRGYVIRGDTIRKVTKDHSLVQSLVDAKQLREEEVRTHPQRNIITRSMGEKASIVVDLFAEALNVGDVLLLCCDGLWEMMQDEEARQIVQRNADPQTAARELIALANKNGGDDNITCVIVRIEDATTAPK